MLDFRLALTVLVYAGEVPTAPADPIAFGRQGNDINFAWTMPDPVGNAPTALEYDVHVLQQSSGSDTDPELSAKAARFAASRGRKAPTTPHASSLPVIASPATVSRPGPPEAISSTVKMPSSPARAQVLGGGYSTYFTKSKSMHTLKGLALPRACHSGEIALAGSRHLRSTLAAAPVLFAHAVVPEIKNK